MNRIFWGVALAAWFGFMVWRIDWLWSLSEPMLSVAQVLAVLSFLIFAAGALLPYKYAGAVQTVIAFVGMLAMWGGVLTML
ncbi:MAG: hypothetical protein LUD84_09640 [Clostridiales bacterium]|nr:hypothetical protein [Clostridiales bacterium]